MRGRPAGLPGAGGLGRGGLAGQGQEDVIEVRGVDGQPVHLDRRLGKLIEQVAQGPRIPVAWDLQGERLVVARRRADRARRRVQVPRHGEVQPDVAAGDAALELRGAALGDDAAVVEHRDPAGELIGLLQVLRGEEDRDAAARPGPG